MAQELSQALDGKRRRCEHVTSYDHEQIFRRLVEILGDGWKVYGPSILRDDDVLSDWPADQSDYVIRWLREQGCAHPEDLVDGHCEPLAVALSVMVKRILSSTNLEASDVPDQAHVQLRSELSKDPDTAPARIFRNFERGFLPGDHGGPPRPSWNIGVWGERFRNTDIASYLFGGSSMTYLIQTYRNELMAQKAIGMMPLYILNYIYSAEELRDEDLFDDEGKPFFATRGTDVAEIAEYSVHVVGLVIDPVQQVCVVADPNGGLLPGGNMEFLSMPLRCRRKPSTSVSQYDIDSRAATEASTAAFAARAQALELHVQFYKNACVFMNFHDVADQATPPPSIQSIQMYFVCTLCIHVPVLGCLL